MAYHRLSIIDLSAEAKQPMSNHNGSVQNVFNGEIYNCAEIRKALELTANYKWKSSYSDTEAIIHAFKHWGIECIHRFRGIFAIPL